MLIATKLKHRTLNDTAEKLNLKYVAVKWTLLYVSFAMIRNIHKFYNIKNRYSTICDVKNVNESPVIAKAGISFKGQADHTSLMFPLEVLVQ